VTLTASWPPGFFWLLSIRSWTAIWTDIGSSRTWPFPSIAMPGVTWIWPLTSVALSPSTTPAPPAWLDWATRRRM